MHASISISFQSISPRCNSVSPRRLQRWPRCFPREIIARLVFETTIASQQGEKKECSFPRCFQPFQGLYIEAKRIDVYLLIWIIIVFKEKVRWESVRESCMLILSEIVNAQFRVFYPRLKTVLIFQVHIYSTEKNTRSNDVVNDLFGFIYIYI